jgi:YegS/Rv2252/BmrU family lipid kinase
MTKAFVVLNPVAGNSDPEAVQAMLKRKFAEVGWEYELYLTTGEEHLKDVVREALERNFDLVIAAGGDGTVSDVADGLVHTEVPLAILPVGTGNVLAWDWGIPQRLEAALNLIVGKHVVVASDAVRVGERYYFLDLSVGLGPLLMRDTPTDEKRRLGRAAYIWTGLKKALGYQPNLFEIEIDGRTLIRPATEVMLHNSGALAAPHFRWDTNIRMDDGALDLCIIRARNAFDYLKLGWSLVVHRQNRHSNVSCHRVCEGVRINSSRPLPVQADGEVIGSTPVEARVASCVLRLVVPEKEGRAGKPTRATS